MWDCSSACAAGVRTFKDFPEIGARRKPRRLATHPLRTPRFLEAGGGAPWRAAIAAPSTAATCVGPARGDALAPASPAPSGATGAPSLGCGLSVGATRRRERIRRLAEFDPCSAQVGQLFGRKRGQIWAKSLGLCLTAVQQIWAKSNQPWPEWTEQGWIWARFGSNSTSVGPIGPPDIPRPCQARI